MFDLECHLFHGQIGFKQDLMPLGDVHEHIIRLFESDNDQLRAAAAATLGNMACGNLSAYLPIILAQIETHTALQYPFLRSFKTIITDKTSSSEGCEALRPHIATILSVLQAYAANTEESNRSLVADCLGKLALVDAARLLGLIVSMASHEEAFVRATALHAVRTFVGVADAVGESVLKQHLQAFFGHIGDSENLVRRAGIMAFNATLQRKPYLVLEQLDGLLQLVYAETNCRQELIREVQMGPFKHRIDDGLDTRKAAFECLFTVLDVFAERISVTAFFNHVLVGLDDHDDIKMLMYLMVARLTSKFPLEMLQQLDNFADALAATIKTEMKKSTQQELEKNMDLKRGALRAVNALNKLPGSDKNDKFVSLVSFVKESDLQGEWEAIQSQHLTQGASTAMDIGL